jgi:ribosomal protein S18 acetylase RimI-like enzyme
MIEIVTFEPADYDGAFALWQITEGLTLREADSRAAIVAYLQQNRGLSFVAREGGALVGAVLAGSDGRRGYLQHLAVARAYRGQGIGRALAERAVHSLREIGIAKCHLMVRRDNSAAKSFWQHLGWQLRDEIELMSHVDPTAPPA